MIGEPSRDAGARTRSNRAAPSTAAPHHAFSASLWLCFAVGMALRISALCLPIEALDARLLPDDAYISLEVARAIGLGQGPRSAGHYTNGVQPLYVLLMAPVFSALGDASLNSQATQDDAVRIALGLLCLCDLANLLLLAALLTRLWGKSLAVLVAVAAWAASPLALRIALGGLETTLALCSLLLLWAWYLRYVHLAERPLSWRAAIALGALTGLAMLARIDLAIAGTCFALLALQAQPRTWRRFTAGAALGFIVSYGPWLAYSWRYTGHLYPISGEATRLQSFPAHPSAADLLRSVRIAAHVCWNGSWYLVTPASLGLLALAAQRRLRSFVSAARPLLPILLFTLSLFAAYALFQGGFWYFRRYLFPVHLTAILILAAVVHALVPATHATRNRNLLAAALAVLLLSAAPLGTWRSVFLATSGDTGYRALALWVRTHVPERTALGSGQTGALAYFAPHHRIINLDGVVNEDALRAVREHRLLEYVRDSHVDMLVGWKGNFDLLLAAPKPAGISLVKLGYVPQLRTYGERWLVYRVER